MLGRFLKRDIQLDAIAGTEEILGLGPLAVDAQTIFSKELANVADWEPALQEICQLFVAFSRWHDDFLVHWSQSASRLGVRQASVQAIFAIL